ncbi:MAG: hypothetical protein US81_C0037G0007 [Parcubacteria group bacterium GW2011_GWE2_38_18]|nr:MAG: hypothetical protein US81_C0037G0007 [Parcubacteria group bacterium GW2011_GWE2_38_18]
MNKHKAKILITLTVIATISFAWKNHILAETTLAEKLKGKIVLQVESHGEAWYIFPGDYKRYFLGRPKDAFAIMKELGKGVSNDDLKKIPIADANLNNSVDSDLDELSDAVENSQGTDPKNPDSDHDSYNDKEELMNGYSPLGKDRLNYDNKIIQKLSGYILIQAQGKGEAWYLNPKDLKRYYLGTPEDAFEIMKKIGLGINNLNLFRISQADFNPIYTSENIKNNFTTTTPSGTRKYSSNQEIYTFEYPPVWRIRKFEDSPNQIQLTDATRDFIVEKKAVIINYLITTETDYELDIFRVENKTGVATLSDREVKIGEFSGYENSYDYPLAYEKTTTIKLKPKQFLRVSLVTAKSNNNYYEKIYDDLLKTITVK